MNIDLLNEQQKKAVTTTEGPLLVLAGAGSGKTKVLTTRIAYLIENIGITCDSILAITFTNKAAKEMKERVIGLLGPKAWDIQISTFHSFGLTILKENYEELGFLKNVTILDSDDSLTLVKKIMKEMNIDIKTITPRLIRNKISGAKNEMVSVEDYNRIANTKEEEIAATVYRKYEDKLKRNNSVDFDDLLILPLKLFTSFPDILARYQDRFKYILVDEYQDTNHAQYLLIKMISAKYKNICVVGDNDQSIYSFRGANFRNILNFEKDYKNPEIIMLEENYRSTNTILGAANDIIKNNKERKDKNLWTQNNDGKKIKYYRAMDEKDESYFVKHEIDKLILEGISLDKIAILYRTNAQSRNMEETLLQANIPYKVVGSFYFYNRKEIKDLISYLKLIFNTNDDVSLLRSINTPKRGIGNKTIENITINSNMKNSSLYDAIESGKELEFKKIIEKLRELSNDLSLTELVEAVLDLSGLRKELENEKTLEADVRIENLEEFKSITKSFEERNGIISLEDFLGEISLVADMEEHKNNTDVVTMMTVHSAKGLEFEYVFIIGLEEGIFPHSNAFMESDGIEEERRLCYVAITRAKKDLWIINAKRRTIYGMDSVNPPSRFINEINIELLDKKFEEKTSNVIKPASITNNINTHETYVVGGKVHHDTFGNGVIVEVANSILTIAFPHPHGVRKLMKGHRSIKKVN